MYSQYLEETAIADAVSHVAENERRLLDIGCWEPKNFSNSRALVEAGWHAVMVDPSPSAILKQVEEYGGRPEIQIVSLAVGAVPGGYGSILELEATDDCVSSTDAAFVDKMRATTKYYGKIFVQCVPLDDLINRFCGDRGFQFINIDAEQQSVSVFLRALEMKLNPACYCVEHDGEMQRICAHATSAGYVLSYSNGVNAVFRRK